MSRNSKIGVPAPASRRLRGNPPLSRRETNPDGSDGTVSVRIHPTQFPRAIEAALIESLRTRRMNHKFHYDTPRQTLCWLRLHESFSPARTDASCLAAYAEAATAAAKAVAGARGVEMISLGCGGGQKEAQLIRAVRALNPRINLRSVPVDASPGLVLAARDAAIGAGVAPGQCDPFVVDLALVEDWSLALRPVLAPGFRRVITFFGMLPNFAGGSALPRLANLLAPGDLLLASANLAPGKDYAAGVERVRPLYDNALTREWLLGVLLDLGVERSDGEIEFQVRSCPEGTGLLRIEADFVFRTKRTISYGREEWTFLPAERFQLFFSYRHTPARVAGLFAPPGVEVLQTWTNQAGDEGVFLCRRRKSPAGRRISAAPAKHAKYTKGSP